MKLRLPHPPEGPAVEPGRTYLIVASSEPEAAAEAVRTAPAPPDLCVTSPSAAAHATAAIAAGGHYLRTIDEPLLARRADGESAADLSARYAQALRVLHALASQRMLVVVDDLPLPPDPALELDDAELLRYAAQIEHDLMPW